MNDQKKVISESAADPVKRTDSGKRRRRVVLLFAGVFVILAVILIPVFMQMKAERELESVRREIVESYGENRILEAGSYDQKLAVACRNGIFVGKEDAGVRSYKGIPYAKPPVGKLRWKAPEPAGESGEIREAFYFGKSGIQTAADTEHASLYPQGEDCLTLNIWTSDAVTTSDKPVMVFFHGGGFGWGGTADPLYDGNNFVEKWQDVVLVTANYRIGLMGFMDFSEVEGGEEYAQSGNLGILDQICALKWIRDNIEGFGGDPDLVTIFGESAGAASVSLLPLIKEARGLFRRVISQSGSVALTYSKEESRSLTRKLLKETGASSMEALIALPEAELMKANKKLNDYNNFPERDGVLLPEDLYEAWEDEEVSSVDMLIGSNADEARYWIGEVGGYLIFRLAGPIIYSSVTEQFRPEDYHYVQEFMDLQTDKRLWNQTEFLNELLFRIPAVKQAGAHADAGGKCFMYYWTKESDLPKYGACHAVELSYVFNNLENTIFTGKKADAGLAETVQEMWVNFARTGDPSADGYDWEPYDTKTRKTMLLGDEIRIVSDPLKEQRELIEPLLSYRINGYYGIYEDTLDYIVNRLLRALQFLIAAGGAALIIFGVKRGRAKRKMTP